MCRGLISRAEITPEEKKVFFDLIVHTVHLSFFSFNFSVITGEYTVKGEQWIVHLRGMSG
ncbi:hypothetical protein B6B26_19880 [Salmonella enterica subsp. enterica serovar Derby]|nr:hypothetical protein [Salmonella enterica]EDD2274060.1 hypothetical protein [Salmonella enterica subsp. enterica serovar Infantis]EDG1357831.1 hypothetical protein [Salmonella enterica subsp. enterica serovar Derby]EDU4845654.1 hypothetical protein [Salmonella enterica subsp. enterica serovar Worthington]EFB4757768.1 hypothetical protein [Escherichia coli]